MLWALGAAPAAAAENGWANSAGNGLWDATSVNWTNPVVWDNNSPFDVAVFGSTGAGVVTLGDDITLSGMRFEAPGYVITAPGNGTRLQLPGSTGALLQTDADAIIAVEFYGSGKLTKTGSGSLILSGANSYTGGTQVNAGTLRIGAGGTTGSVVGPIVNNSELVFDRSNPLTFSNLVWGSGHVTKTGAGTLTLSGAFQHTGGTTVSEGILHIARGPTFGLFSGDLVNNAEVVLSVSSMSTATFGSDISGTGVVTRSFDGNAITLTGTNTYTGGTRILNSTLQVGDGGTAGSIVGDVLVDVNGTLALHRGDAVTFGGVISGAGKVNKLGSNSLTLIADNTYTGMTTISGGTLSIGDGGTTGSVAGSVTNNANLAFNRANDSTYAGVISGIGAVTKRGAGTLTLTGANTYAGGTTVAGGTLSVGNGGASGAIAGYVANGGAIVFNRNTAYTFAGTIDGSGSVLKLGSNTLTLTGQLAHTGGTTVSAGTLQVSTGILGGDVVNNAAVVFEGAGDFTYYDGSMSGAGSLSKTSGGGRLTLTGTNTYLGGTVVTSGILALGAGGTMGSIVGNVALNGSTGGLAFHRSDPTTFAGSITGSGKVQKLGGNTLTLTGSNSATGGLTISGGTLAIGDGASTGGVSSAIVNNARLTFNQPGDAGHSGVISGPGMVTKLGTGTLTLTGANTYTGGTTVSAGTLSIGNGGTIGSITGDIVNNGAVVFNRSDSGGLYNGTLSGPRGVTKLGAGTFTITGRLAHTGETTVSAGTLQIGTNLSPGGSVEGDIVNNGFVRFAHNGDAAYGGAVSGTGGMFKSGLGKLVLTGANTYAGHTAISGGSLQLGAGGTSGSIAGSVSVQDLSDELAFHRSDHVVFPNAISGSGTVTKLGTNRLALTGESSFDGFLSVHGGTLAIGDGGASGSIAASIFNEAEVVFDRANDSSFSGSVSGAGSVVKRGAGALSLGGSFGQAGGLFGHAGGTTVEAGTLRLSTGSSLSGNVLNNAAIEYTGNSTPSPLVLPANISGLGNFTKTSSASTLAITGDNTYTGGTFIRGGILQIGNGGTTGSIVGNVDTGAVGTGMGTIAFNRFDDVTFPGVVSGAGHLRKTGASTLSLTAAHTYTGSTDVVAGTLALEASASISSSANIETSAGATLDVSQITGGLNFEAGRFALAAGQAVSGNGTIAGDMTVRAGASVAPGPTTGSFPSLGTLNVAGDVDFRAGSSLEALVLQPATSDRLTATGELTFAGTASDPFTINVTNHSLISSEPRAYTIATGATIGSSGLDTPLVVEVGADGMGAATNVDHIQLNVIGFAEHSTFTLLRAGNVLRLQYVSPIAADFNDNGVVDAGDLARWTANTGLATGATNESGDADADGDVDGSDFLTWQRQLGSSRSVQSAAVPEPAAAALVMAGLLAAAVRNRNCAPGQSGQPR